MARTVPPEVTLERLNPLLPRFGITRVANLTGLDRVGIPVVAVVRPNSRSYSVSQGKGITLEAAKASGLMESIECHHAEETSFPLRFGRFSELKRTFRIADVAGLPRLSTSLYHEHHPLLWAEGAADLLTGEPMLVPLEAMHLDCRVPRERGAGCFTMSSNGLASGNHLQEAIGHALCEVIERDANALWHVSGTEQRRRLDLDTVDDPTCRELLKRLDQAELDVLAWDTTTDVRVASVLCDVVDRNPDVARPMPAVRGSGTHPLRRIALSRALTEAVQGRLTRISGSRDDLSNGAFDDRAARRMAAEMRKQVSDPRPASFADMPNAEHDSAEGDVRFICTALRAAGLSQILMVDLTRTDLNIPVVRVVVPHLEAMSELPGYVPGNRARRVLESRK